MGHRHGFQLNGLAGHMYRMLSEHADQFYLVTIHLGKSKAVKSSPRAQVRWDGNGGLLITTTDQNMQQQFRAKVRPPTEAEEKTGFNPGTAALKAIEDALKRRGVVLCGN